MNLDPNLRLQNTIEIIILNKLRTIILLVKNVFRDISIKLYCN